MANRTIKRAYAGTSEDSRSVHATTDSESGSAAQRGRGIPEPDSSVDADGTDDERVIDGTSSGIGYVEIDPSNLGEYIAAGGSGDEDDSAPRKRRKRGPNKSKRDGNKEAAKTVEPFLMMVHTLASVYLKTPELALDETEAKKLSEAYSTFCLHHDIPVLSEKRMSEIQLISAAFMVYVPRMIAVRNRWKDEERVRKAKNVTPFGPVPIQPPVN